MKTQNQMVLEHLKTHIGLTTYEAYEKYGITRLSSRIHDLREDGYPILAITRVEENRHGKKVNFSEYRLIANA